jgi:DNA polymerase I-like protein with 3'-5' exonuclease and polymerase domains
MTTTLPMKSYGAALLNHICQSLAYVILMQAARRLHRMGLRFAMQIHDELVFCVRDEHVEQAKAIINTEMERSPEWLRELPLAVEITAGTDYGSCKT